jgi:hypothetical protein
MAEIAELELARCDKCRVQGLVRVELLSGLDLMFCGHHYDKFAASLAETVVLVEDTRVEVKETADAVV